MEEKMKEMKCEKKCTIQFNIANAVFSVLSFTLSALFMYYCFWK